jgi:hypothetical protein
MPKLIGPTVLHRLDPAFWGNRPMSDTAKGPAVRGWAGEHGDERYPGGVYCHRKG